MPLACKGLKAQALLLTELRIETRRLISWEDEMWCKENGKKKNPGVGL